MLNIEGVVSWTLLVLSWNYDWDDAERCWLLVVSWDDLKLILTHTLNPFLALNTGGSGVNVEGVGELSVESCLLNKTYGVSVMVLVRNHEWAPIIYGRSLAVAVNRHF